MKRKRVIAVRRYSIGRRSPTLSLHLLFGVHKFCRLLKETKKKKKKRKDKIVEYTAKYGNKLNIN
jgi:hypothetical protein